jgi:hypothetical protein
VGAKLPGEEPSYSLGFPPRKLQDIAKEVRGEGVVAKRNRQRSGFGSLLACLLAYLLTYQ